MTQNSNTEQHKFEMTQTSKRDALIVSLRQEGKTYAQIATAIPCSNQTVYKVLHEAGLIRKGTSRGLSQEQKDEIVQLRTSDPSEWTYMALATKFSVQSPTINKVLRAAGLTRPRKQA